ncbi:unnamed protein product [Closterium sp. NIES-54]
MDVVGPLKLGAAGAEYFLTILDIYTRMTLVYVLSKKGDVAEMVKPDWLLMVERQQDRLVKAICTDRGGEFPSKEFSLWLKKNGIRNSLTMPYSRTEEFRFGACGAALGAEQRQHHHKAIFPYEEEREKGESKPQIGYEALGKPAKSALAEVALIVGDDEESDYNECAFAFFSPVEMPGEPATLKEAMESTDSEEWKKAVESELKSIEENGTWELVELPEGRKAITSKWLFKINSDTDGKIERYNSRLVAKGYQQKEKVDCKEFFAPVVKPTTLQALLAGATIRGWVVKQMDVTTAFLSGILEEEIFLAQPEGVVQCPNEEQVAAGMRVAKNLSQTPTVGLQYSAAALRRQMGADGVEPGRLFLTAFLDASYASEPEDMTSVGGLICCVGGGPTAWESKKQVDQALSSV